MMIGVTPFSSKCFDSIVTENSIHNMQLQNAKYDEIKIDEAIDEYSNKREEWDYDTVFLAKFQENLLAGNVDFMGLVVNKLRVKRRKKEDFEWQILGEWDFDIKKREYEMYDKYVESYQPYEYTIVPLINGDTEGNLINVGEITPKFEGSHLIDKYNNITLLYDVEYNNVVRNQNSALIEPINSQYPMIINNSTLDYMSGSIESTIMVFNNSSRYDIRKEKLHRKKILDFLCNRKPKMLKNGNGESWLIRIINKPSISYFNELEQVFAKVSFDWVEIGKSEDLNDIRFNGLL